MDVAHLPPLDLNIEFTRINEDVKFPLPLNQEKTRFELFSTFDIKLDPFQRIYACTGVIVTFSSQLSATLLPNSKLLFYKGATICAEEFDSDNQQFTQIMVLVYNTTQKRIVIPKEFPLAVLKFNGKVQSQIFVNETTGYDGEEDFTQAITIQ